MRQYLWCLLWLIGWCACNPSSSETGDSSFTHVFHYNQPNAVTSLDPAFARSQSNIWVIHHLYNTLVQLDDSLQLQPGIARDWQVSADGLTYTFHLRSDVFFHDDPVFPGGKGRRVVAQDVVYSFLRILDERVNSPGSWIFSGKVAEERPFTAPDDSTFVLRLQHPFLPMLGILTMQYCSVVAPEAVEEYGLDFRVHPVGTGPFRLKNWMEGQAMALVRNERYFEKQSGQSLPLLEGLYISFIADRKTAYLELKQGQLDFMSGLESSYVNDVLTDTGGLQPALRDRLQLIKAPYLNMEYLGINLAYGDSLTNPLLNRSVRQALNYGLDRARMLKSLRNGVGWPAEAGFIPRGLPSWNPIKVPGYTYDRQKARQLLAEAGYPNGEGMPPIQLMTNRDYLDLCTFAARQWQELGIQVRIEMVESATLRQMMSEGQASFFRASWIADYPDGESFLTVFYGKNPAPPNYMRFQHPAFDSLYEQSLRETDTQRRMELYQQMDRILVKEAPVVFLFYDETALFAGKEWSGISRNALNLLKAKQVRENG